jgi:hypothetical protein
MGLSTVFGLAGLAVIVAYSYGYAAKLTKGTGTSRAVQGLFSATFSLTCGLFGLMLFEITSIMNNKYQALMSQNLIVAAFDWFYGKCRCGAPSQPS